MSFDETKDRIRRRRYADLRRCGESIPPDLASRFKDCPACNGRGTIGYALVKDGVQVEIDDVCPNCNGEGFVQIVSPS